MSKHILMQKWEQERRAKIHKEKLRHAKSSISTGHHITVDETVNRKASVQYLDSTLKSYSLQQYSRKLSDEGITIPRLLRMKKNQLLETLDRIKVFPGHVTRFKSMLKKIRSQESSIDLRSRARTTTINFRAGCRSVSPTKPPATGSGKLENSRAKSFIQSKLREQRTSQAKQLSNELAQAKAKIERLETTKQLTSELEQAKQKIAELEQALNQHDESYISVETLPTPINIYTKQMTPQSKQSPISFSPEPSTNYPDPSTESPQRSTNYPDPSIESPQRSTHTPELDMNPSEPQVGRKFDPSKLGHSWDSIKMRSTLVNIDIEEVCRCLGRAVAEHIRYSMDLKNNSELSLTSMPDFDTNRTYSVSSFTVGEDSLDYSQDSIILPKSIYEIFNIFTDPEAVEGNAPDERTVYTYCKNVIIRCKMEKEIPIICLVYLERLTKKTTLRINETNWKRLLFILLWVGSKVWDDESYENVHFAKTFTNYSIRDINKMEGILLNLIEFQLVVGRSEYAKYYFVLRTYAQENDRSHSANPLDLETVLRLQQNGNKAKANLEKIHADSLYKTY